MSGKTNIDKENAVRILDFWFFNGVFESAEY